MGETKGKPSANFDSPSVTAKDYVYSITKALLAFACVFKSFNLRQDIAHNSTNFPKVHTPNIVPKHFS